MRRLSSLVILALSLVAYSPIGASATAEVAPYSSVDCTTLVNPEAILGCYQFKFNSQKPTVAMCKKMIAAKQATPNLASNYMVDAIHACGYVFGLQTDVKGCLGLPAGRVRQQCIHGVAVATRDSSLCKSLPNGEKTDLMTGNFGPMTPDFYHENGRLREGCYADVAVATGNVGLCAHATQAQTRKWCVTLIAGDQKDLSICSKLPTDEREECQCNAAVRMGGKDRDCTPEKLGNGAGI